MVFFLDLLEVGILEGDSVVKLVVSIFVGVGWVVMGFGYGFWYVLRMGLSSNLKKWFFYLMILMGFFGYFKGYLYLININI